MQDALSIDRNKRIVDVFEIWSQKSEKLIEIWEPLFQNFVDIDQFLEKSEEIARAKIHDSYSSERQFERWW